MHYAKETIKDSFFSKEWCPTALKVSLSFLALSFLVWVFLDILNGPWDHDGGYYLALSFYIKKGLLPYIDFPANYPPLMPFLNAVPLLFSMEHLIALVLIPFTWVAANAFVTFFLVLNFGGTVVSALLWTALFSVFSIENGGNHVTLEHGIVFFSSLSLLAVRLANKSRTAAFLTGFFFACACLTKQVGIILLLPLYALLKGDDFKPDLKNILPMAAGFISLPFITLAWLNFDLGAIFQNLFVSFYKYSQKNDARDFMFMIKEFNRSPFTAWLFFLLFVSGLFRLWKEKGKDRFILLSLLLTTMLFFFMRCIRNYPHYSLNCWPFLVLSFCYIDRDSRISGKIFRIGVIASLTFVLVFASIRDSIRGNARWSNPGVLLGFFSVAAKEVRNRTLPEDKIVELGEEHVIQFLSERLPQDFGLHWYTPLSEVPDEGNLTILIDFGQGGVAEKRKELVSNGYDMVYRDEWRVKHQKHRFHYMGYLLEIYEKKSKKDAA